MKTILKVGLPIALILGVILTVVYWPRADSTDQAYTGEWTCSMHPQIRLPKPGKCPICGMDLVPASQASKEKDRIEKRAGILTEPIAYRELSKEIRTVGKIDYSDIPAGPAGFWENAVRRGFYRPVKRQLSVRVDADILAWLKSQGAGYHGRLNQILRSAMLKDVKRRG